jgi:hypothetical protein
MSQSTSESTGDGTCQMLRFVQSNSVRLAGVVSALLLWAESRWPNIPIAAVFAAVVAVLGTAEASHQVEQKNTSTALDTPAPPPDGT